MALVLCPVHGVNLGQMAFESPPGLDGNPRQGVDFSSHGPKGGVSQLVAFRTDLLLECLCLPTSSGNLFLNVGGHVGGMMEARGCVLFEGLVESDGERERGSRQGVCDED